MKSSFCLFAVAGFASLVFTTAGAEAGDSDGKPLISTVAQANKPKQENACRTRYRSCVKANQVPSFECQYIYQDCMNHIY